MYKELGVEATLQICIQQLPFLNLDRKLPILTEVSVILLEL
jgi:hypothetical protein